MKGITALGNEEIGKLLKKELEIIGKDIQYQEAVLEVLENNKNIEFLILSSIIPGQFNIYEFINLITFKNSKIKIIIFLEKRKKELEEFLISKGINNIYYNNEITIKEMINSIKNNENINNEINKTNRRKIIKNKLNKKFIKLIKKEKNKKNKKIITIIGAPKIGKTIFSIIFCLINKNKKILLINLEENKNNLKIILGKKFKEEDNNIIKLKKYIDLLLINFEKQKNNEKIKLNNKKIYFDGFFSRYDYIIVDTDEACKKTEILEKSDEIILMVEANLLGISETKRIIEETIKTSKIQKDNIKIVFNKQNEMSISKRILKFMFEDFTILGELHYDKYYNLLINSNAKIINSKIKKKFLKIIKKI